MTLQTTLANLKGELSGFLALLDEETAALGANQADALAPLLTRRDAANRRLSGLWQALSANLALPADAGIAAVRERCAGQAAKEWAAVEALARRAEQQNRLNGKLVDEQLHRTQAALQVLHSAAGNRTLYGSDGRMSDFLDSNRSIDTA